VGRGSRWSRRPWTRPERDRPAPLLSLEAEQASDAGRPVPPAQRCTDSCSRVRALAAPPPSHASASPPPPCHPLVPVLRRRRRSRSAAPWLHGPGACFGLGPEALMRAARRTGGGRGREDGVRGMRGACGCVRAVHGRRAGMRLALTCGAAGSRRVGPTGRSDSPDHVTDSAPPHDGPAGPTSGRDSKRVSLIDMVSSADRQGSSRRSEEAQQSQVAVTKAHGLTATTVETTVKNGAKDK
jgi:hypothetical protein